MLGLVFLGALGNDDDDNDDDNDGDNNNDDNDDDNDDDSDDDTVSREFFRWHLGKS